LDVRLQPIADTGTFRQASVVKTLAALLFVGIGFQGSVTPGAARASGALILASGSAPVSAEPQETAEDASILQQNQLRGALGLACDRSAASDEIVVCGKRKQSPYRLPLPAAPEPGVRQAGEAVNPFAVMGLNPEWCPPARPRPPSENLDVLALAATLVAVAAKVADPEAEPVKRPPPKNCG
jgi:hypothetical protein